MSRLSSFSTMQCTFLMPTFLAIADYQISGDFPTTNRPLFPVAKGETASPEFVVTVQEFIT